jgi:hypothetical protein
MDIQAGTWGIALFKPHLVITFERSLHSRQEAADVALGFGCKNLEIN